MKKTRKTWSRRKEILAVLPAPRPLGPASLPENWTRLLRDLSREWRVFLSYAPRKGENLPVGTTGTDPVSLETLPAIKRVLQDQLVSAVVLIGESSAFHCLEELHSFAPHVPFVVVLDGSGREFAKEPERAEFVLGWADRIVLSDDSLRASYEPLLRRLHIPVQIAPHSGRRELWDPFIARFSKDLQDHFLNLAEKKEEKESTADWIAILEQTNSDSHWSDLLGEWRKCLPKNGGTFLLPAARKARWRGPIRKLFPESTIAAYADEEGAVALANQALSRSRSAHVLCVTSRARPSPVSLGRLSSVISNHPLAGMVDGARAGAAAVPMNLPQWHAFAQAWFMKNRGVFHVATKLADDYFLLNREALAQIGFLDSRLGWTFAVHDLNLRMRQSGWALFRAQDVVVAAGAPSAELAPAPPRFKDSFLRKWSMDPAEILGGERIPLGD